MKIVCDACSAKYSIADDKVKGKVFKIRCKKCSNIIVVRGSGPGAAGGMGEEAPPAQFDQKETRVYDYGADGGDAGGGGDEAVWHIVVDQEQVGPVTVAEVQRRFTLGEIDADTFIWREGFADWQPLAQVDAFAHVVGGGGAGALAAAPRAQAPAAGSLHDDGLFGSVSADEGGTVRSDPNDLFAAAAAPAGRAAAGDEDEEGGGDLFGANRGGQRRSAEMAAQGGAAGDKKLRGERNENSVLFSLGNLAALASDAPRASAAPSSSSSSSAASSGPGPGAAGHGGGEGSGLIDIRSMASAYLGADKGGPGVRARPQVGSVDDLPVFSSASFSEPVVIMPTGRSGGGDKKILYALVGVVGLLALVAIVLVVMVLTGGKKNDQPAQVAMAGGGSASGVASGGGPSSGTATPPAGSDNGGNAASGSSGTSGSSGSGAGSSAASAGSGAGSSAGSAVASGSAAASGSAGSAAGSAAEPPPHGTKPGKDPKHGTHVADAGTTGHKDPHGAVVPPPDTGTKPPAGGKCMDEVGCLLADHPPACCSQYKNGGGGGGGSSKKPPPDSGGGAVDSSLPEELDRAAVSDGVGKVRGRINACGDKSSAKGEVKVSVKVSPSGSVSSVSVKNTPDGALGSCVQSAMQGAHFPKTQKGGSFSYPFIFR